MQDKIARFRQVIAGDGPEATARARNIAREMQFLEKLRREIDDLEEELL
jgi:hypothetical protein